MPIVLVPPQVAISKQTGETIRGGTGKVYADTDYNLTSELICYTDATGGTATQPQSSSEAIIPEFWVNLPESAAGVFWVAAGVRVWLASRDTYRGRPGSDGSDGKTAYQYAVEGGYQGSEAGFRVEQREVGAAATNAAASAAEAQAAREAAEAALGRVDAPTDTVVADLVDRGTSSTQASLNARYASKDVATSSTAGLMAATDKALLDAASSSEIRPETLVLRDSNGSVATSDPILGKHAANKDYVQAASEIITSGYKDEAGRVANQSITTEYRPTNGAAPEHYLTVFRNGDKTPGSVRRIVGGNSNSTNPPQETLTSFYAKTGATVLINGSGWWETNRIMGLSIKDGVLIQGWEASGDLGNESCVIMRDGELRIYAKDTTPDPATIIADGGFNSFSWGAAVYKNGSVTNFRTKYTRYSILSARQCVGSTTDGHIFIMTFPGATGSSGANGDGLVAAAQTSGLNIKHMYVLDGGGSAQAMITGETMVQSSDGSPRAAPDALYFYGPLSSSIGRGPVYRFLRASSTNSVPNAVYTPLINMGAGPGDNPDCSVTLNGTTFTVREAGVYSIEAQILFPNNATGSRYAAITINGTNRYRGMAMAGSGALTAPVNVTLRIDAGSTVELQAYQNSGNSLTLPADADGTRLSILRVR